MATIADGGNMNNGGGILDDTTSGGRYVDRLGDKQRLPSQATLLDFSHLSEDVRRHLKRVYLLLLFTTMAAAAGAHLAFVSATCRSSGFVGLSFFSSLALILVLAFTRSTQQNAWWRSLCLVTFGFLQGILVAPLITSVAAVDPAIPLKAFLLTVLVFACFSASALLSAERKFLYLYGMCMNALFGLVVLSFLNLFFHSTLLENVWLYGGLMLFSVFVAVDTQIIIERALRGDSDSVQSALDLFLDALNIFVRIMIILSRNKKSNNSSSSMV